MQFLRPWSLVALFAIAACGGSSSNPAAPSTPSPSPGTSTPTPTQHGTMSAKIDGMQWNTVTILISTTPIAFGATGIDKFAPPFRLLVFAVPPAVGTYRFGTGGSGVQNVGFQDGVGGIWTADASKGSGSVTLTTYTSTGATGTLHSPCQPLALARPQRPSPTGYSTSRSEFSKDQTQFDAARHACDPPEFSARIRSSSWNSVHLPQPVAVRDASGEFRKLVAALAARAARIGSRDAEAAAQEALKRSLATPAPRAAIEYYFHEHPPAGLGPPDWPLEQLLAWLHGVLRFVVREESARVSSRREVLAIDARAMEVADSSPGQLDLMIDDETQTIVRDCLAELNEEYRRVLLLRAAD
jgi:DNA-directed RNA polymerase specialized sigma24 family protein